jgi:hypothetical protein
MRWTDTHAAVDEKGRRFRRFATDAGRRGFVCWDPGDWLKLTINIEDAIRIRAAHELDGAWHYAARLIDEGEREHDRREYDRDRGAEGASQASEATGASEDRDGSAVRAARLDLDPSAGRVDRGAQGARPTPRVERERRDLRGRPEPARRRGGDAVMRWVRAAGEVAVIVGACVVFGSAYALLVIAAQEISR